MSLADAIRTLADEWPTLVRHLTPLEQRVVRQQLAAAVHGGAWDPAALLEAALTDQPSQHPAWLALLKRSTRRSSSDRDDQSVLVAAMRLRLAVELTEADSPPDEPDEAERRAEERIFEAPMRDLRDEQHPGVLALPQGTRRLAPVFQFDSDGHVRSDVAAVNEILQADDDPWGTASWWLCPHASLNAIPADEIVLGEPERVLAAAVAAETGD